MRLTPNQRHALNAYPAAGQFSVPPECQGQAVERSYGCDSERIYIRALDHSDRTVTVTAFRHPADDDGEWSPWNGRPRLGRRIGVIYSGPVDDEPATVSDDD